VKEQARASSHSPRVPTITVNPPDWCTKHCVVLSRSVLWAQRVKWTRQFCMCVWYLYGLSAVAETCWLDTVQGTRCALVCIWMVMEWAKAHTCLSSLLSCVELTMHFSSGRSDRRYEWYKWQTLLLMHNLPGSLWSSDLAQPGSEKM